MSTFGAIVLIVVVVFGAPFFEELFFRGLVQGVLTRRYGGRVAIVTQAVAFGFVHYQIGMTRGQVVLTLAMIIPVGFLLGCLRWRYERLGPGWSRTRCSTPSPSPSPSPRCSHERSVVNRAVMPRHRRSRRR